MTNSEEEQDFEEEQDSDLSLSAGKVKDLQDSFLNVKPSKIALEVSKQRQIKAQREATIFVMTHDNPRGQRHDSDVSQLLPELENLKSQTPDVSKVKVQTPSNQQLQERKVSPLLEIKPKDSIPSSPIESITPAKPTTSAVKTEVQKQETTPIVEVPESISDREKLGLWGEEPQIKKETPLEKQPIQTTSLEKPPQALEVKREVETSALEEEIKSKEQELRPIKPKSSIFNKARSIFSSIKKKSDKDD